MSRFIIERVHCYIGVDPEDDSEGIPMTPPLFNGGPAMLLFVADERRLALLYAMADMSAKMGRLPATARMVRFSGREPVDEKSLDLPTVELGPWPGFRITEIFALMGTDPATGDDAIPGVHRPPGIHAPAVAVEPISLRSLLDNMRPLREIMPMRLVKFTKREDVA